MRIVLPLLALYLLAAPGSGAQTLPDYAISGRVNDEFGQPIAEVRVCADPADYDVVRVVSCGRSNGAGNFVIPTGRAAHYKIYAEKLAAGYFQQRPFFEYPGDSIPEIVLNEGNKTANVFIRLPPKNGELVGNAIDAGTGRPVDDVRFLACQVADRKKCWSASAKNAAGEFRLLAAHVPFTLRIFAEGYQTWSGLNSDDVNQSFYIPSGAKMEVLVQLRRRPESVHRPLSEAEKQPGINLPAPLQTGPVDDAEFDHYPRKTKLEWQYVQGATAYRIEIDYCNGRPRNQRTCVDPQPHYTEGNTAKRIEATSYELDFVGAQPGRWRVWAMDEKGQEGFKSPWRAFFYLH